MSRKENEAVPVGNGPVPQQEEFGSGEPTLADVYRLFEERFDRQQKIMDSRFDKQQRKIDSFFDGIDSCSDRWNRKLDEISDEARVVDQHVTSLEHGARQPRLAMEADGPANIKTRDRTEGAATARQVMREEDFSASRIKPGPNTISTSFGEKDEPPAFPRRDDVVVESGNPARSCLPSLEMRLPTYAGGLLPTGEASTATRTTSNEPLLPFYATEERNPEEDS